MIPERKEIVRSWYRKASSDLAYAKLGLTSGEVFRVGAVYHCQQAAEKAIKALHCFYGLTPPKSHDLVRLVELLQPSCDLQECLKGAEFLTPMATEFRYPGESEEPTEADAQRAWEYAEFIFRNAEFLIKDNLSLL